MQNTPTALITGATGGLGVQLCREFARHGYNLVITARDPEQLRKLAAWLRDSYDVRVSRIVADLNQENAVKVIYGKIRAAGITVDVLVNNAGFGQGGYFVHNRPRLQDAMLHVNLLAPTRLCRAFLPGMLQRGYGGILNIASLGSFVPGPYNAVYCATKAYLLSLTEALAEELRCTPIQVTAVCPGAMHTGFAHRADMESTALFNYCVSDARKVARSAYRAFAAGRIHTMPGVVNRTMILSTRLAPRCVLARISGAIQRPYSVRGH